MHTLRMGRARVSLAGALTVVLAVASGLRAQDEPELIEAFAFGVYDLDCATASAPGVNYTIVLHTSPQALQYDAGRGWGYEAVYAPGTSPYGDRAGYGIFGPFDDSGNNRNVFDDSCPSQLYDSFIGAKTFSQVCSDPLDESLSCEDLGFLPEGIIFRVDVPNGRYRFVAAAGSADNAHATRVVVENGGDGPPEAIGDEHVVLIQNYDQGIHGTGTFARVGFGCQLPPTGNGPQFVNVDDEGLITDGPPDSAEIEITEGYIRVHQLQGNSTSDPNGGNLVILELWRVPEDFVAEGNGETVNVAHSFLPDTYAPGDEITVTLDITGVNTDATVVETVPEGWEVVNDGGGDVEGNTITFEVGIDAFINYTVRSPSGACGPATFTSSALPEGGCETFSGGTPTCVPPDCGIRDNGAASAYLHIGPIAFEGAAGAACDDAGRMGDSDYFTDGEVGETNVLVAEGDEIIPDFFGAAAGAGVGFAPNPLINPDSGVGVLEVWRSQADANGLVDFNLPDNIGDPLDNYIIYSLSYVENTTGDCLPVMLEIGTDDSAKVRLNGQLIHYNPVCRGVPAVGAGDMVPAVLRPGVNILLIASGEAGGGTGVRLIVRDETGVAFTGGEVEMSCDPPGAYPAGSATVTRTISPGSIRSGETATVSLDAADISGATTIVETFPSYAEVVDDGGGVVASNTITFELTQDGAVSYELSIASCPVPADIESFSGDVTPTSGCGSFVGGDAGLGCVDVPCEVQDPDDWELVGAYIFGSRALDCPTFNDPGVSYTPVFQGTVEELAYSEDRGWGYELLYDLSGIDGPFPVHTARGGFEVFGPFDESANGRAVFPDTCPEEIYDSFIGAKNFLQQTACNQFVNDPADPTIPCDLGNVAPVEADGIIFRVDVPNGEYRFVAAAGSTDNPHAHRVLAENGGEGPPVEIGDEYVTLINNFDQAQQTIGEPDAGNPGEAVYARVGFGGRIPPPGDGVAPSPRFVNMDEEGFETDAECPESPTLDVTEGYIRLHQLQAQSNPGPGAGGGNDPNGSDMVVLELWRRVGDVGGTTFVRGDADASGVINLTDGLAILLFSFQGAAAPACMDAADTDDSGTLNLTDAIIVFQWLFLGGNPPAAPQPSTGNYVGADCGEDTSDDGLGCESAGPICSQ